MFLKDSQILLFSEKKIVQRREKARNGINPLFLQMLIFYSLSGRPPPHFPLSGIEWNILLSTPCMQSTLSLTRCVGRGRVQRNVFRRRRLNLRPLHPTTLSPSKPDRETPSLHPPSPYSEKKVFRGGGGGEEKKFSPPSPFFLRHRRLPPRMYSGKWREGKNREEEEASSGLSLHPHIVARLWWRWGVPMPPLPSCKIQKPVFVSPPLPLPHHGEK